MAFKRPESVLVVLYDEHGQVLIMQRNDDPNFWQSVTGTIEENELPLETAYREVFEEIGIQLRPELNDITDCEHTNRFEIRPQWRHRYPPGEHVNTEFVFCAQIDSTIPLALTEHSAYEWVSKSDAVARVWSPSNRQSIEEFVPESK